MYYSFDVLKMSCYLNLEVGTHQLDRLFTQDILYSALISSNLSEGCDAACDAGNTGGEAWWPSGLAVVCLWKCEWGNNGREESAIIMYLNT